MLPHFSGAAAYCRATPANGIMIHTKNGFDRTSLAEQGVSRITGFLDRKECLARARNSAGSLFPQNVGTEGIFDAREGELALTKRGTGQQRWGGGALEFMVSMNGAGSAADGVHALMDGLVAAGFCGNPASITLKGQDIDNPGIPLDTNGQRTLRNTGPDTISPGDTLYWELPADGKMPSSYRPEHVPAGRIIPVLRVYNPKEHGLEAPRMLALREAITANREAKVEGAAHYRAMHASIRTAMLMGALLASEGSVGGVVNVPEETLRRMADVFLGSGEPARNANQLAHMLLAPAPTDAVVTRRGKLYETLASHMANHATVTVAALLGLASAVRRRIVGRAVTGAPSGKNFEAVIGLE